ncbi:SLC13 family permease [Alteromonas confluentis]|uniref:Sodium:dicarboxylate symporter n=1 Tax=Alteromonas confluentis TaxID=1656094 RepID=A0A1E7ZGP2_9ALTE|nr:SLC13 family permease [Alteromonas confluentis]OFC72677.1 sodium:dicarboxylate symporter [Alteromonas confluentis]
MHVKYKFLSLSAVASLIVFFIMFANGFDQKMSMTAGLTVLIAMLWMTEAMPIPVTSLIPFFAFPMAGVMTYQDASSSLGSHVILLLMGGFMLSKSLEKSGVHRRLAVYMLKLTGASNAKRLVLGFMLTSAVLSMWISNTATCLMLLPIALAIISSVSNPTLASAILLGIAYAASIGGVGTPIGTPPNIIFMSVYQQTTGTELSFLDWMKTGIPVVLLAIPVMALWLTRNLGKIPEVVLPQTGEWKPAEKRVLVSFLIIALAWVFRPFWTEWLNMPFVSDSTIAIAGVVMMCLIPDGDKEKPGQILDWDTAAQIPWGLLMVYAGGICLAKAFTVSGLSVVLGNALTDLSVLPIMLLILVLCLAVSFVTEVTSNTATATLLMPILASAAVALDIDPIVLMMPAAISASCAFMMPVATPTNTIVYGSGHIDMKTMVREGTILNILVAFVVTGVVIVTRL